MNIKEIKIFFSEDLIELKSFSNLLYENNILSKDLETFIIPKLVLDRFEAKDKLILERDILIFSQSKYADIYLGIELNTENVICFSKDFTNKSFMNSNYLTFLKCVFLFEIFRKIILIPQKMGDYHKYHQDYAEKLKLLIYENDKKASIKGVWFSQIEEMRLGVI